MADSRPYPAPPGHTHALAASHVLDALVVHVPALAQQQLEDTALAVARMPGSQFEHVREKPCFVVGDLRLSALGRSVLPDHLAGTALAHVVLAYCMLHGVPSRGRA